MNKRVLTAFATIALVSAGVASAQQCSCAQAKPNSTSPAPHRTVHRIAPAAKQSSVVLEAPKEPVVTHVTPDPIVVHVVVTQESAQVSANPPAPPTPAPVAEAPVPSISEAPVASSIALVPTKKPVKQLEFDEKGKVCDATDTRPPHECLKDHDITVAEMQAYCASFGPESNCFRNLQDLRQADSQHHMVWGIFLGDAVGAAGDGIAAHNGTPIATAESNSTSSSSSSAAATATAP